LKRRGTEGREVRWDSRISVIPPTVAFFWTPGGSVCENAETATIANRIVFMRIEKTPRAGYLLRYHSERLTLNQTIRNDNGPVHGGFAGEFGARMDEFTCGGIGL